MKVLAHHIEPDFEVQISRPADGEKVMLSFSADGQIFHHEYLTEHQAAIMAQALGQALGMDLRDHNTKQAANA